MKRLLLTAIACLAAATLTAQSHNNVRRMEYELGLGINQAGKYNGGAAKTGMQIFFETRMNFTGTPYDVGAQAMFGYFDRKADDKGVSTNIRHRITLSVTGDYNLRRWRRVAPFVGVGVGYANVETTFTRPKGSPDRWLDTSLSDQSVVISPRIGVELFSHLRITAEYRIMKKEYSFFGINIGGVFGGGQKQKQKY